MRADTRTLANDAICWLVGIVNGGRYRKYRAHQSYIYLDIGESTMMLRRVMQRYEVAKHRFLANYLKQGMVFVDVGANKGDFSLFAKRLVGDDGIVIAVEPEPQNCRWLEKSIAANGYRGIRLIEAALTDGEGEATLYLGEKSGWHTLTPGDTRPHDEIRVRTTTLDALCTDLPRVDAVKIDVQGAENSVLAGASATLSRWRPVVLLDLHPNVDVAVIERLFDSLNYDAFPMTSRSVVSTRCPKRRRKSVSNRASRNPRQAALRRRNGFAAKNLPIRIAAAKLGAAQLGLTWRWHGSSFASAHGR